MHIDNQQYKKRPIKKQEKKRSEKKRRADEKQNRKHLFAFIYADFMPHHEHNRQTQGNHNNSGRDGTAFFNGQIREKKFYFFQNSAGHLHCPDNIITEKSLSKTLSENNIEKKGLRKKTL